MPDTPQVHLRCELRLGALELDINFTATKPWTVIFGPSGSGKSTLLRVLAGLEPPLDSCVLLSGTDISRLPAHRRRIALVAQQPGIFPHLSVQQNIAFACTSATRREVDFDAVLRGYRLLHVAATMPANISGGERQRTAIARAVQSAPRVLLLDEVFTGMQNDLRTELIARLRSEQLQWPEEGMQIISVTHDIAEAFTCADEVVKLHDGRIVDQGPAEKVLATERAALLQQLG